MAASSVGSLLVSQIDNVRWLSGFTGSSGFVVISGADVVFITDSRYAIQAQQEVSTMRVATFASPTRAVDFIGEQCRTMGITSLGFESASVTYSTYEEWKAALEGIELTAAKRLFEPLRMIKTAEELNKIRRACALADKCFDNVLRMIQPGVTEYDIMLDIEFYFRRSGAELAFAPIVVSGVNSARPHGKASEKKLEVGDFVTMDFGAKLDGYCSDLTRTVVVGEASERTKEVYAQVLKAQMAALDAMKPGVSGKEVDAVARQVLDEKGMGQYFGHGLGHGLGPVVHDFGGMSTRSEDILAEGQVWTVEPGVYIEGFGGVRIEDDVVVTATGIELLTHSPKELMLLPA